MTRKAGILIAGLCSLALVGQSQTKAPVKKPVLKAHKVITKPATEEQNAPKPQEQVIIAAPSPDTTVAKKDTSKLQEVAQVVHDSVKAQIKAPIVQVPVTLKSLIIPGVLFAYGAVTLNSTGLRVFNEETHEAIWNGKTYKRPFVEDYLLLVPAATVYGLNIAGIKGQNNLVDRSVIYGMSNLIANGIVFGVKFIGVENRPDSSDHYSFPSGHTAEAFVSAEFLHQEYKGRIHWSVIAGGYAVAVGVAYLRMYHNKHWLSDVVAGAGVGIASTRFAYYLYPLAKHLIFGARKVKGDAMIMPTYNNGMPGFAFIRRFK